MRQPKLTHKTQTPIVAKLTLNDNVGIIAYYIKWNLHLSNSIVRKNGVNYSLKKKKHLHSYHILISLAIPL